MNTNQKKLKLVKEGIKTSTLNKMTDSQVDALFSKLQEQIVQPQKITKTITQTVLPPGSETTVGNVSVANKGGKTTVTPVNETDDSEIDEKFESKKQQKYFFAKCGDGKTKEQKKWCKMADEFTKKTNFAKLPEKKKETNENYSDMVGGALNKIAQAKLTQVKPTVTIGESEIEKQIMRLVEKHITPKMSKKDFENLLEGDTKTAPAKPKVSPGTKPKHPFQPDPNKKGAPKAKKKEMGEDTKTAPAKPKVSPGTTPKHPFQPDPNKKGAPKAINKELPSFLKFNQLGLK
jgi:uncharacterized protein YceH (UPF0502 family)